MKFHRASLFFIIAIFVLSAFYSCEKDVTNRNFYVKEGVFILNEGNYTYGNSSLSFYNPDSNKISNQIFSKANKGSAIGDVLQSMTIQDSLGYLVVNNSGKIMVVNTNTFQFKSAITGLVSPRQLLILNSAKAYVSDLYSNSISIIDLKSFSVTGSIHLNKSSESMVLFGNYVFVSNWSKQNTLQRIDISTDKLTDSLVITKQPNSMVLDKNNKLWVLSDGGYSGIQGGKVKACLTRINPVSFSIEQEFVFPDNNSAPTRLSLNRTKDTLFYLNGSWGQSQDNGGVYKMAVTESQLPVSAFIPENGRLFYALGIDPKNSDIYVSDAIDYQQPGWVFRYSARGAIADSFKTDIIPAAFCFKYEISIPNIF